MLKYKIPQIVTLIQNTHGHGAVSYTHLDVDKRQHVDSRSRSAQTDVFFYQAPKSVSGKKLAVTMKETFESKYDKHCLLYTSRCV